MRATRRFAAALFLVGVTIVAAPAPAQQRWRLPAGGSAVFEAAEQLRWYPVADPKRRPAKPTSQAPYATMLFASELDDDQLRLRVTPTDVRWIAPAVAFDLGVTGRCRLDERFEWVEEFGHLRLRGAAGPVAEDGTQTIELQLETEAPKGGELPDRVFAAWLERVRHLDARGRLVVTRRIDAQRGVVAEFTSQLELDCVRGPDDERLRLELEQRWTLAELRDNRGAGFGGRVADAVRRAAGWIHAALARGTRWDRVRETSQSQGAGAWALMLLALLHAEYDAGDTVVRARLNQVRRAELTQTYSLSLAILLLEKLYAPRGERDALITGAMKHSAPRQPGAEDRALLEEWTKRLLANRDRDVDRAYVSRWSYSGNGYDNSNTQFALLALHSAALCGVEISRGVWHSAAQHLLTAQTPTEGKAVRLQLIPHRDAREAGAPRLLDRSAPTATARGFSYRGADEIPYGAMTCAGISGSTLCIANLTGDDGKQAAECAALQQTLRDGFAWLARHRTLRRVAGDEVGHHDYWYYYWLYSLERACELSQTAWIGEWDWYNDGAELLLASQRDDGSWGGEVDTSFALLFLKQAQLPVITGLRNAPRRGR
ncbi:MAG: hypothetical protein H6835_10445 [Planctomycetes bacterium]|nr:hypothetical protein [Planctomycetota bacterium]